MSARTASDALRDVIDETRRLFHRLANAADRVHAEQGVSASQRALLETLSRDGAQSVPQIARAKAVSRQHIQTLANQLADAGLVTTRENPAHQRSVLLTLTEQGERCFREIDSREQAILRAWTRSLQREPLELAAKTLRAISEIAEEPCVGSQPRTQGSAKA